MMLAVDTMGIGNVCGAVDANFCGGLSAAENIKLLRLLLRRTPVGTTIP